MHSRSYASIVTNAIAVAAAAGTCFATDYDIRDAAGGMNVTNAASTEGLFLQPTGGRLFARTEVAPAFKDFASGTFGFERRVAGSSDPWEAFKTYCFEPDIGISFQQFPGTPGGVVYKRASVLTQPGITAAEATQLEILWKHAFADSFTTNVKAAAFQSIVWELGSTDASFNLAAGNFQIALGGAGNINLDETAVKAQADAWYGMIGGAWTTGVPLDILVNSVSQNLIVERPPDTFIPLPTAGLMASVGLIGLVSRRRRQMA